MRIWLSAIWSKHHASVQTRTGTATNSGKVQIVRYEWGFGKGEWKRAMNRKLKAAGSKDRVRAVYFLIGSFYRLDLECSAELARAVYEGR